jgi:hypothetical protein
MALLPDNEVVAAALSKSPMFPAARAVATSPAGVGLGDEVVDLRGRS